MVTKEQVENVLKKVEDPELQIDIFSLGLIYNIDIVDDKTINIRMTFTSPQCPFGPAIVSELKNALQQELGFEKVGVEVVFNPRWEPSDELKAALGIGGLA